MAQTDYFLDLGADYLGESSDKTYKDKIDVLAWSWGESNTPTMSSGGLGSGKVMMQDLNVTMNCNKVTPKLMLTCANGAHIPEAKLVCRRAGTDPLEYLVITLTDCIVSSYQTGGSGGDVVPIDQFSLAYQKIEWAYTPQDAKGGGSGKVITGYDLAANTKV